MTILRPPKEEEFVILVKIIIEVMSTKSETVTKALEDYMSRLKDTAQHPDVRVVRYAIADPKKQDDETYTSFVEAELKFPDTERLIGYCFDALPSSIEIIEPHDLSLSAPELTGLLNDLQSRLHKVNHEMNKLQGNYALLEENSIAILRNFLIHLLKQKPLPAHELANILGLNEAALKALITRYIKQDTITFKDDHYHLTK